MQASIRKSVNVKKKIIIIISTCITKLTLTFTDASTCMMSEWITWSPCSMSCGAGVRSRERYVKQFPDDGFACTHSTEETEPCTVNDDCCEYYFPIDSDSLKSNRCLHL